MLKNAAGARVYVIAGKYTQREICESFLERARCTVGLEWEELGYEGRGSAVRECEHGASHGLSDSCTPLTDTRSATSVVPRWGGIVPVRIGKTTLTDEDLVARRDNCWGWIGRWSKDKLVAFDDDE